MKRTVFLILIFFCFILQGCSFHKYGLAITQTNYVPEPDSAIVIIGFISDCQFSHIGAEGELDGIVISGGGLFEKNTLNTLALHHKVGDTFQLTYVPYKSSFSQSSSFRFKNLPKLNIDKPGIYYYGFFQTKDNKGFFSADFNQEIINKARWQYPTVFKYLKPVNFKKRT